MRIDVTQEDILAGTRNDCTACPIALAVRPFLPAGWQVYVRATSGMYDEHGILVATFRLPKDAVGFIEVFDASELYQAKTPVEPFSFNLSAEVFMR